MYYYLLLQKLIKSHSKISGAAEENTERKKIIHNLTIWRESLLTSSCTTVLFMLICMYFIRQFRKYQTYDLMGMVSRH